MRDRWYRWFWTELGSRMQDPEYFPSVPSAVPAAMSRVLAGEPPPLSSSDIRLGEPMSARAARHIYQYLWKDLASEGFSRPRRLTPWEDVTLLLPFYRKELALLPQSFSCRVPARERVLSLCGRTGAALLCGVELWIVPAMWDESIEADMHQGGLKVCSLDRIGEVIC